MAAGGRRPEKPRRRRKAKAPRAKAPARREARKRSCGGCVAGLMSAKARRLMASSVCIFCKGVVSEADRRRRRRRGSFIGTSEVRAALDAVMKGEAGVYVASTVPSRSS